MIRREAFHRLLPAILHRRVPLLPPSHRGRSALSCTLAPRPPRAARIRGPSPSPTFSGPEAISNEVHRRRRRQSSSPSVDSSAQKNGGGDPRAMERVGDEVCVRDRVRIIPLERGVAHVLLSRPDKLNSLDVPMFEAIADAASRLMNDESLSKSLRAVILSGEGRSFCTGLDAKGIVLSGPKSSLGRLLERPSPYGGEDGPGNLAQDVSYLWRRLPVPVIACLHGMCFGGGLQIALGADMRFSTPDCRISIMESRWGLIPDMGASVMLRELVRMDVAKELTMTGRVISGREAERVGMVTRCVDDPVGEAMGVAREIVERSPDSVAATKELFQSTWVMDEKKCLKKETDLQLKLIKTWNQIAASGRNFGVHLPYCWKRD